jgi:hypothetical protein
MFAAACFRNRHAIYGIIGSSQVGPNQVSCTSGTAFMIVPGVLVTAAHLVHVGCDAAQATHAWFEVIRAPDVGQHMERAALLAQDPARDLALLTLKEPRSSACVTLEEKIVAAGTGCGSLGFPLAKVTFTPQGKVFQLVERFQGAHISAFYASGPFSHYETDSLMYRGSSGCPGFLADGRVFAMHVRSVVEETPEGKPGETRLGISLWVPAGDIIRFAEKSGVKIA